MKEVKITQAIRQIGISFKELGTRLDSDRKGKYSISYTDSLLSGLAVFQLKMPSLLQYDQQRNESRLRNLFGIKQAPSDTRLREMLDEVNPEELRAPFKAFFEFLRCNRYLEAFKSFGQFYSLSVDSTQHFCSKEVHCDHCLEKHSRSGSVTYSHQMLAGSIVKPGLKEVIPVCPEPIIRQDGATKNDCELNAFYRFYSKFKNDHPKLPCIFLMDGLFSKAPVIQALRKHSLSRYIISAKPGDHKYLFDWVLRQGLSELTSEQDNGDIHYYQYYNNAPLNEANSELLVNFLRVRVERNGKNKTETVFSFVTDLTIDSDNIDEITALGRARWKVENETFNTLKNQGYNFEHNFGHGYQHLSTVLAMLMFLAFAVDQFQLLACQTFQKVLQACFNTRYVVWENVRSLFRLLNVRSWEQIYQTILTPSLINTS